MKKNITVSLPEEIKYDLDLLTKEDGVTRSDIVRESLRDYIFIRKFKALRRTMTARAKAQGIHTDDDVFKRLA
ncbi:MAG: ribbon-helix-helix protein, CopG family [Planctomycetota bacterium]